MLYKSLVRSTIDYGLFVYAPRESSQILKLERGQYLGIRTALGYRNSTPNNVIIAEVKIVLLLDRARMLAKNFCSKILKYKEKDIKSSLEALRVKENYAVYRNPLIKKSVICTAWEQVSKIRNEFGTPASTFEVWKMDYDTLTNKIKVDLDFGQQLQNCDKKRSRVVSNINGYNKEDLRMINEIKKKYNIQDDLTMIYTDGARPKKLRATGASVVFEDQDESYSISLPRMCSSFTAEAFTINTALELMIQRIRSTSNDIINDIIILTDCQAVLKAVTKNIISVYQNRYILEIKTLHGTLTNIKKRS
ncbi:pol-like protein [Lasius niger]|uniref:Pol-like protein n=1 Tax=Lasius niger TaxID=67767 RepID=A0A0J7JZ27_LASNI|nr:pol-like protein [Lasius niger]